MFKGIAEMRASGRGFRSSVVQGQVGEGRVEGTGWQMREIERAQQDEHYEDYIYFAKGNLILDGLDDIVSIGQGGSRSQRFV